MNTTDKLNLIISKCKASVTVSATVSVNNHKGCYITAAHVIANSKGDPHSMFDETSKEVLKEMAKRDTIIVVKFYPRTPVSFYNVAHYDLDMALDECLEILSEIELDGTI